VGTRLKGLCSIYQRYNLKAIHNRAILVNLMQRVVLNISKIQSESNSQLLAEDLQKNYRCAQYIKDTI